MHYKFYAMDRAGHIAFAHDVECQDDNAAEQQIRHETSSYGVEVWQGSRLVARHHPEDGQ